MKFFQQSFVKWSRNKTWIWLGSVALLSYALFSWGCVNPTGIATSGGTIARAGATPTSALLAQWVQTNISGTGRYDCTSVVTDIFGSVYVLGSSYSSSPVSFGNGITTPAFPSAFLVKYAPSGLPQWVVSPPLELSPGGVATDGQGNIYISGSIGHNLANFGNGVTLQGVSLSPNGVLVKYSANGQAQWARTAVSGTVSSEFHGVATDSLGNIYVAGFLKGFANLGGTNALGFGNNVTARGLNVTNNLLIVKYNSQGVAQWARTCTGGATTEYNGVTVDNSGNVYAVGTLYFQTPFGFGNGVTFTTVSNARNAVLVKYDSAGVAQWATGSISSTSDSKFTSVTHDASGNVFVTASLQNPNLVDFGNGVAAAGNNNGLIVKYNSSGQAQWGSPLVVGTTACSVNGATVDQAGNVYAVGSATGTALDFGNSVTVNAPSYAKAFIVQYSSSGQAQWAQVPSVSSSESALNATTVDGAGNVYSAGSVYGSAAIGFGSAATVSGSTTDDNALLVKFGTSALPPLPYAVQNGFLYDINYSTGKPKMASLSFSDGAFRYYVQTGATGNYVFNQSAGKSAATHWGFRWMAVTDFNNTHYVNQLGIHNDGSMYDLSAVYNPVISTGWNNYFSVTVTDLNNDQHKDLVAVDKTGTMYFFPGTGGQYSAMFGTAINMGTFRTDFRSLNIGRIGNDVNLDLIVVLNDGTLWVYPGTGGTTISSFGTPYQASSDNLLPYSKSIMVGDVTGDNLLDVVGLDASGNMSVWPGTGSSGTGAFGTKTTDGGGWRVDQELFY